MTRLTIAPEPTQRPTQLVLVEGVDGSVILNGKQGSKVQSILTIHPDGRLEQHMTYQDIGFPKNSAPGRVLFA